jgi:integrase
VSGPALSYGPEVQVLGPLSDWPEDAVGKSPRRWNDRVESYLEARESEIGETHRKGLRWVLRRFPTDIWPRVGVRPSPTDPRTITRAQVVALRESPEWAPKTRRYYLEALRGVLRWSGCALANERGTWALDGTALNRRWLTGPQLVALWEASRDDLDRLIVGAAGFNGLRRVEVLRLRCRDLVLTLPDPEARIWGKGGRYRTIPVTRHFYGPLVALSAGKGPTDRVFPYQRATFDSRLAELGRLAGVPVRVSGHDLRRTFGRLAYAAGVPLVAVQNVYGHKSPTMTAHYVGIDRDQMAAGLAQFERSLAPGA